MFSRFEGPPPALDGPLAVNTRLQRGRRLFSGQLKGPESFTADQNGEPGLVLLSVWFENCSQGSSLHCVSEGNIYTGTVDGKLWRISNESLTFITQMGRNIPECGKPLVQFSFIVCEALHVAGWICIGCHGGVCWKNPTARVSRCHHTLDMLKWFTKTQVLFYQSLGCSKESWMQMSSFEHTLWFLVGSRSLCWGLYTFDASLLFEIIIMLVKELIGKTQAECKMYLSVSRYSGFLVQACVCYRAIFACCHVVLHIGTSMDYEPVCGRPHGLRLDRDGQLIVADSYQGLFKVDPWTGEKTLLHSSKEGR